MQWEKGFRDRFFASINSMKMRKMVLIGLSTSFLLSTIVSILSLSMMANENTKAMNMMLTARIYDTINNTFSEPVNVAKTMAVTQQVKESLIHESEIDDAELTRSMQRYLADIKDSFHYETAFVVSNKSKRYFTYQGMMKTIHPEESVADQWYTFFVDHGMACDLSVDRDTLMPDQWTVFINTRVEDDHGRLLGACGVAMKVADLQALFRQFEEEYHVKVNLVDRYGVVKVDTNDVNIDHPYLGNDGSKGEAKAGYICRTLSNGDFTVTKHVEYLDWDLVVTNEDLAIDASFIKVIVSNALVSLLIMLLIFGVLRIILKKTDATEEEAALLAKRMAAAAQIYMDFQEINILDNSFVYAINYQEGGMTIDGSKDDNAQAKLMAKVSDLVTFSQRKQVKEFLDFATLDERLKGHRTITCEFMAKNGLWLRGRFILCQLTPLGRVNTVLWLVENITEERKSREELLDISARATAANEAKSTFLSNMSHEIRTPINAILGMNEMILRESQEKSILEYAENIRNAGRGLLSLVNDILDFSKIEAGKMEIVPEEYDLSSLINDLVNMIKVRAEAKGLTLTLDIAPDMPKILFGDDMRIKQIITNLLTNAVKYTDMGGIVFALGYEKCGAEEIMVHVSVKDTGQGIRQEDMHKLFANFERINEGKNHHVEGTGLGLSITQRLLGMMGAKLKVHSVYKLGSNFYFSLKQKVQRWEPLGDYKLAYKTAISKHHDMDKEKLYAPDARILVVDDNHMNVLVFRNLLKRTGAHIDSAYSGDEGLSLAYDQKYDIIFLDHMMPQKDGVTTLQELKARQDNPNRDTPVVCLTANAISGAKEMYLEKGFNAYLSKPIDPIKLEQMLLEYLPSAQLVSVAEEEHQPLSAEIPAMAGSKLPGFLAQIGELDLQAGIKNNGDEESYRESLKIYASMVDKYIKEITDYMQAGDVENATIKIHALKSTSRIIGALAIGELAQRLENAGKAGERDVLERELDGLLQRCQVLGEQLRPLLAAGDGEDEDLPLISLEALQDIYLAMGICADNCDSLGIEELIEQVKDFRLPEEEKQRFQAIRDAADNFDFDQLASLLPAGKV
ncbi:MAG: response regulator [Selenomonas sp.]|uniref:hybrid sensor histidine kinase/response regulator n=1 Tax=Selenomonas sp. TaxID=2053611 RepID=UPI0025FB6365|nr:hybrid sensor histidine kinase/response regulator [Selenomonas sp.]MCR5757747.1 response regulator [Selenomonas sp.]